MRFFQGQRDYDRMFGNRGHSQGQGERESRGRGRPQDQQTLPVNVFTATDDSFMIVAPMPGLEPENITISVEGRRVVLHGERRGEGQDRRNHLLYEWTYGPYHREIEMPSDIDAEAANASFDNGVVTLHLPRAAHTRPKRIELAQTGTSRGLHGGNAGPRVEKEEARLGPAEPTTGR
jgi:HSP20 family protein